MIHFFEISYRVNFPPARGEFRARVNFPGAPGPAAAVSHRARKSLRAAGFPPPRHPSLGENSPYTTVPCYSVPGSLFEPGSTVHGT